MRTNFRLKNKTYKSSVFYIFLSFIIINSNSMAQKQVPLCQFVTTVINDGVNSFKNIWGDSILKTDILGTQYYNVLIQPENSVRAYIYSFINYIDEDNLWVGDVIDITLGEYNNKDEVYNAYMSAIYKLAYNCNTDDIKIHMQETNDNPVHEYFYVTCNSNGLQKIQDNYSIELISQAEQDIDKDYNVITSYTLTLRISLKSSGDFKVNEKEAKVYEGDIWIEISGKHRSDPLIQEIMANQDYNFVNIGYENYKSKEKGITFFFSESMGTLNSISLYKDTYKDLLPGGYSWDNILKAKEFKFTPGYNNSTGYCQGHKLYIFMPGNDIQYLMIDKKKE